MFGIGTGEIAVLIIVGVIILGPERMRTLVHRIGSWVTRIRREADTVRQDLDDIERNFDEHGDA